MNKKNDKKSNDFALISEGADGYIFGVDATDLELIGGGLSGDCETPIVKG